MVKLVLEKHLPSQVTIKAELYLKLLIFYFQIIIKNNIILVTWKYFKRNAMIYWILIIQKIDKKNVLFNMIKMEIALFKDYL